MTCEHCNKSVRTPRFRSFPEDPSRQKYLICDQCSRAQRSRISFKPARARERARIAHALTIYEKFRTQLPRFKILVWGPSPRGDDPGSRKRRQIRQDLEQLGHDVAFSEDLGFLASNEAPANAQEWLQIEEFDFVINLAASYGPLGEAHEFALALNRRMLLWLPQAARKGYFDSGLAQQLRTAGRPPLFFQPDDLQSCVISLASSDWIADWQSLTLTIDKQRESLDRLDPRRRR